MSAKTDTFAESNPAIARCCDAYRRAYQAVLDEAEANPYTVDVEDAHPDGEQAYADALPPLLGVRNIRNFIACVAHGSAKGMLDGADASRLLYAAQVAFSTRRLRPSRQKDAPAKAKSTKKPPLKAVSGPVSAIQEPFSPPAPGAEPLPLQ